MFVLSRPLVLPDKHGVGADYRTLGYDQHCGILDNDINQTPRILPGNRVEVSVERDIAVSGDLAWVLHLDEVWRIGGVWTKAFLREPVKGDLVGCAMDVAVDGIHPLPGTEIQVVQ